jgi:hypothetical protein
MLGSSSSSYALVITNPVCCVCACSPPQPWCVCVCAAPRSLLGVRVCQLPIGTSSVCVPSSSDVYVVLLALVCSISISLRTLSATMPRGFFTPVFCTKYLAFSPSTGALAKPNNITKIPHYSPISNTLRILTILIVTKIVL